MIEVSLDERARGPASFRRERCNCFSGDPSPDSPKWSRDHLNPAVASGRQGQADPSWSTRWSFVMHHHGHTGVAPALIARSEEERIPDRGDRREQVVSDRCDFIDEYGLTFPAESSAECGPRDARGARDRGHRLATSHHPSPHTPLDG